MSKPTDSGLPKDGPFVAESEKDIDEWDSEFDSLFQDSGLDNSDSSVSVASDKSSEESENVLASEGKRARRKTPRSTSIPPPLPLEVLVAESAAPVEELDCLASGEFELLSDEDDADHDVDAGGIFVDPTLVSELPDEDEEASDAVFEETKNLEGLILSEESPRPSDNSSGWKSDSQKDFWAREFQAARKPMLALRCAELAMGDGDAEGGVQGSASETAVIGEKVRQHLDHLKSAGSEWGEYSDALANAALSRGNSNNESFHARLQSSLQSVADGATDKAWSALLGFAGGKVGVEKAISAIDEPALAKRRAMVAQLLAEANGAAQQSDPSSGSIYDLICSAAFPEETKAGEWRRALASSSKMEMSAFYKQAMEAEPREGLWPFLLAVDDVSHQGSSTFAGWQHLSEGEQDFSRAMNWKRKSGFSLKRLSEGFESNYEGEPSPPRRLHTQSEDVSSLQSLELRSEMPASGHYAVQNNVTDGSAWDSDETTELAEILEMGEAANRLAGQRWLQAGAAGNWERASEIRSDAMSMDCAEGVITAHSLFQAEKIGEGRLALEEAEVQIEELPASKWFWQPARTEVSTESISLKSAEALESQGKYEDAAEKYRALLDSEPMAAVGLLRAAEMTGRADLGEEALVALRESTLATRPAWVIDAICFLSSVGCDSTPHIRELLRDPSIESFPLVRRREISAKTAGNNLEIASVGEALASLVTNELDRAEILLECSAIYRAIGNQEGARDCSVQVLEAKPDSRLALLGLSLGDVPSGRAAERARIEEKLGALFAADPASHASIWCGAATTMALADGKAARDLFKNAWKVSKTYEPALWSWRRRCVLTGDWAGLAESFADQWEESQKSGAPPHGQFDERGTLGRIAVQALLRGNDIDGAAKLASEMLLKDLDDLGANSGDDESGEKTFLLARHVFREAGRLGDLEKLLGIRVEQETSEVKRAEVGSEYARLLTTKGDADKARESWLSLGEIDPGNASVVFAKAQAAIEAGNTDEAIQLLSKRTNQDGNKEETALACKLLADNLAVHRQDFDGAFSMYKRAVNLGDVSKDAISGLVETGMKTNSMGEILSALEHLSKREASIDTDTKIEIANALVEQGQSHGAALWVYPVLREKGVDSALDVLRSFSTPKTAALFGDLLAQLREDMPEPAEAFGLAAVLHEKCADVGTPGARSVSAFCRQVSEMFKGDAVSSAPSAPSDFSVFTTDTVDRYVIPDLWVRDAASILRRLRVPLAKHFPVSIKRFSVGRGDKVRNEALLRPIIQVANSMGISNLEVYQSEASPYMLEVACGSDSAVIVGSELLNGASPAECRFIGGYAGFLLSSGFAPAIGLEGSKGHLLLRALVAAISEREADGELGEFIRAEKIEKLISSNARELAPYARSLGHCDQCEDFAGGALRGAERSGIVAAHDMLASITVLAKLSGADITDFVGTVAGESLLAYAHSDDLVKLCGRLLGV